jgi:hypothetical protein
MKVSELHNTLQTEVDDLQKKIKNMVCDQFMIVKKLEDRQQKMKSLMDVQMKEGDRELSEEEITMLSLNPLGHVGIL